MLKFRRKKKVISIFLVICILSYFIFIPVMHSFSNYLSKTSIVKANILIVDGCLSDDTLEMAYEEFQKNGYEYIITTGIKSSTPYYNVSSNGYLIFYPKNRFSEISESSTHRIEVDAFSELGGDNRAHFNMFINDSLVSSFFAEKRKKKYGIDWEGNLKKIDSIMLQFDNDGVGEFRDRNLYVKEIIIDHKITIPYLYNSEYDIKKLDGKLRIINNYNSNAELARNRLLAMGIDSSQIISTSGDRVRINRTLTNAIGFRDWLKTTKIDIEGINIISMGTHSRRTWMTYNKILKKKYNIGIISLPDYKNNNSKKNELLKTFREALGIIYYWFILIPY